MLATREQAGTVRPANERPAGEVPVKPAISWLRNLRPSADQRCDEGLQSRKGSNSTKSHLQQANKTSPRRRTIEIKTKIIRRLLNPERGTVHELGIQRVDGQFTDKEAESQYKEFIRQLRVWSLDSAHPENDPLHEFNEYHTFTFKRVYRKVQVPNTAPQLRPYICFIGFNSEGEAKRAHAKLASRRVQSRYCPLLGLCYDLDWEQLSGMPSASFIRDANQHTLCGNLISIGEGRERRIVTIGGLVTDGEVTWALTAGHLPKEAQRSRSDSETLTENDLDLSDYNESVEPPLIMIPATASSPDLETPSFDKPHKLTPPELGDVEISGEEWSLIRLKDETLALPNCAIYENRQPVYLFNYAQNSPLEDFNTDSLNVTILGGVTGPTQVRLLSEITPMRLPGGKWIDAWVAEAQVESQLKRGDSGSWVVDVKNGIVYGHVLSISGKTIYILSLAHIFNELSEKNPSIKLYLVQPFTSFERLASTYYSRHNYFKSKYYAEQALQSDIVRAFQERSAENAQRADEFIQWASTKFGLNVDDSKAQADSNSALELAWSERKDNDLDPAQFDLEMTAPGPSRVKFKNLGPLNLGEEGPKFNQPESESRKGGDWDIGLSSDAPMGEYLFLRRINGLKSYPEPASYLEISNYSDPADLVMEKHNLTDSDLEHFLIGKEPLKPSNSLRASQFLNGVRLLVQEDVVCPEAFSYNFTTLEPSSYMLLMKEMKLPLVAVEASSVVGPFFWWTHSDELEDPRIQFVFRYSQSRRPTICRGWEIILSYSMKTRITTGYVRWATDASIQKPLEHFMRFSKSTSHPLMLPLLALLHKLGMHHDEYYRDARAQIRQIEAAVMGPGQHEGLALDKLFQTATECQTRISNTRPQNWMHIINKVTQAMDCYWSLLGLADKTPEQKELHLMLMGRLSFLAGKLESAEHYVNVSSERLKNMIELIQFLQIAENSKTNLEMLTALKYQKRNDNRSNDKQVIFLLAVFLPGTFVASFFSTSFFNFNNSIRGVVSNKLWIYFVLVVPLTVIVLGAGWAYNRNTVKRAELDNELGEKHTSTLHSGIPTGSTVVGTSETMTGAETSEDVRRRRKHWTGFSAFESKV